MPKSAYIKVSGVWRQVARIYVRTGGVWRDISNGSVRTSSGFQQFYPENSNPVTYTTPGTYSYQVPAGRTSLAITYPRTSGIVTSNVSVNPLQTYTVTIGNYGSGSSFGSLLSVPEFNTGAIYQLSVVVDRQINVTVTTATNPVKGYSATDTDYTTIQSGMNALGLTYNISSSGGYGNQTFSIGTLNSTYLINTFRAQVNTISSRGPTTIIQQPTAANNYQSIVNNNDDGFPGSDVYNYSLYYQQIVSLAIA